MRLSLALAATLLLVGVGCSSTSNNSNSTTDTTPVGAAANTSYTLAEVQTQAAAGKCWTVVNGGVYDLTNFTTKHPGGSAAIKSLCGINGTAKFQAMHGGQPKPENTLKSYYLGALK